MISYNKSLRLRRFFINIVALDTIIPFPLFSVSLIEEDAMAMVSQYTRKLKLQQYVWGGLALWTRSLYLGCTSEWLGRTPYSPSCIPPAHKSPLPRLQAQPRCWAEAVVPRGSTGHTADRRTPPVGCRSARQCRRGHRCLRWRR